MRKITFLLFLFLTQQVFAQVKTLVTGKVSGPDMKPLAGVSVEEKDKRNGTSTKEDGSFSLAVTNPQGVLVVSYVGFGSREIAVEGRSVVDIQLQASGQQLEQVIVVGYGTTKRENLIGSVAQVSGEDLQDRPVTQLSNALAGQMPGVTVLQRTGQPGMSGGVINVRGVGSFGASSGALVIVDGIPGSMNDIDPNDVETISVLKDASSAAIYGARAANGVILVTTKSGKQGKMKISYNGYVGFQKPSAFPEYVGSAEYAPLFNEASNSTSYTPQDIQKYRDGSSPDTHPNSNFLKSVFSKSGMQTAHNFSVSSGTANTFYNLSMGYLFQDGLVVKNHFSRYNLRLNVKTALSSKFDLTTRIAGIKTADTEPNGPATFGNEATGVRFIINQAVRYPSIYPGKLSNGFYGTGVVQKGTPVSFLESDSYNSNKGLNLNANVRLDYKILEGLKLSAVAGYNELNDKRTEFKATQVINANIFLSPNELTKISNSTNYYTVQGLAEYSRKFGRHQIGALGGYSFESNYYEQMEAFRNNLPGNQLQQLNVGAPNNQQAQGTANEWAIESLFGRVNYSYSNKYLVEGVVRRDGSSRFPSTRKYAYFPSGAIGYRIGQESFIRDRLSWVNELKLKASIGILGNQNIPNYPYQNVYNIGTAFNYPFGPGISSGVARTVITDPDLHWETTRTTDLGFEFAGFKNKLNFSATYFDRYTYDILYSPGGSVSTTLGFNLSKQNTGKVSNKGWEFTLGHHNAIGNFNYNINTNFSIINNKVLDLGVGNINQPNGLVGNGSTLFNGYPMQIYYGYVADGIFTDAADIAKSVRQTAINPLPQPGDIRYKDLSGPNGVPDGKVDATYDRIVLGSNIPKYTFGVNLSASFKGFDVGMLLQGIAGVTNYMNTYAGFAFFNFGSIQKWQMEERWTKDNPRSDAGYPRLEQISNSGTPNTLLSSFWVLNGSYLRGKNVQLGYTLSREAVKKIGVASIRLYASGENLFLISKYRKGWDPEVGTDNTPNDDTNSIIANGNYYPLLKNFTIGLNINF